MIPGRKTIADPQRSETLLDFEQPASVLIVCALPGNSGDIYLGVGPVRASSGSEAGFPICPGAKYKIDGPIDLGKLRIAANSADDGITYVYQ